MGFDQEPDAPGVLITGTPPSSLHGGASARTAQAMQVAVEASKHDFPHAMREILERHRAEALRVADLGGGQLALWGQVQAIWLAAGVGDAGALRMAVHADYHGWAAGEPELLDREAAVARALEGGKLLHHELVPRSIAVHDGRVGVAHYVYAAAVADEDGLRHLEGRRTEVYLATGDKWLLLSSSGGVTFT